ncbi:MAG: ArsC/Spx/MgsR family protein [Planctomycetota bacterium]
MSLSAGPDDLLLLHNPRCSKSRQLLAALNERGASFRVRQYLEEPLDAVELRALFSAEGQPAIQGVRAKEAEFTEAGLSRTSDEDAIIAAVVRFPKLLERPVLVRGERAAIGRPTEAALTLLD